MIKSVGKIGYITSRYPLISHTFVQREIVGLRQAGYEVVPFTVRATPASEHRTDLDREEAQRTEVVVTASVVRLLQYVLLPALRNAKDVAALFRLAAKGHWGDPRQLLWRLFYTFEAVLVWKRCNELGIRHLHAHHANVAANLAWLAVELGRRVDGPDSAWRWTFTMHGPSELMAIEAHDLGAKAEAADGVACISDFTRSQLMLHTQPESWERFRIVHCGIDTQRFAPLPADQRRPRGEGDPFVVLSIGRISAQKGFPVLVDAIAKLQDLVDQDVKLIAAGEGPNRMELQARCDELGIDAKFIGPVGQDEILDLYHQADAFCLPSFMEGLPVVLMEALGCELPVVTTDVAGIGEMVVHTQTGLLTRPGRADLTAAELARLARDPNLRARLGAAGRIAVLGEFDIEQTVAGMARLFGDVAEARLGLRAVTANEGADS